MSGPPPPREPGAGRRLVVLRHGQTTSNADGIWQGQIDSPLSPVGEEQAAAVGPALARLGPARVVSSDLQRARRTGDSVARAAGVPIIEDVRLREIHAGAWQGRTNEDILAHWPDAHAALRRGEDVTRPGGGESLADVRARMGEALSAVLEAMGPSECVVVSTHGAAGRAGVSWLLGLDMLHAWRMLGALGNAHWAELVEGGQGWRLRTWNVSAGDGSPDGTFAP